jgi:hypothetical protein
MLIHVVDEVAIVYLFRAHQLPANRACGNTISTIKHPTPKKCNDLFVSLGTLEKIMCS